MRRGGRQRLPVVLTVTAALLGACTHTPVPTPDISTGSLPPATATASAAAAPTGSSRIPAGPLTSPRVTSASMPVRACANGSVQSSTPEVQDVIAGPVLFPNAKLLASPSGLSRFYGGGQVPDGPNGSKFYKMGTLVKAGATATISVAPSARSYLRLQQGPSHPLQVGTSFVFRACPGASYTGWVGGFDITGPLPVCVALDVQVNGEPAVRHLSIPFGKPSC